MTQRRKRKKSGTSEGFIGRLFAQTQMPYVTEEQDWYLDTPDIRLTRVFTIVLILHVVAVGGILAFKMIEKASGPASIVTTVTPEGAEGASENPVSKPAATGTRKETENIEAGLIMDHPSAPGYAQYRVGSGESLVSIARRLKVSASQLREVNQLSEGARLMPGRWLLFPKTGGEVAEKSDPEPAKKTEKIEVAKVDKKEPVGTPEPTKTMAKLRPIGASPAESEKAPGKPAPVTEKRPAASTSASGTYQVQRGDTFFGIARQFGVNYKDLMAFNGIEKPENLQAGMTLRIPE